MQIEFAGEPREFGSGVVVLAQAAGRPFVCVVSSDALDQAARTLRLGVTGRVAVFRQYARRFGEALAAKLAGVTPLPSEAHLTSEDLRRAER